MTIRFVRDRLHLWRDDPDRDRESADHESEEVLNGQLCKFLNVAARTELPMVHFHHEERQTERRRVDLSANPTEQTTIHGRSYTIYTPFLVLEGKRLPTPTPKSREREYVHGQDGESVSGGIQRFKCGLHGADVDSAAMIGYLQDGDAEYWHDTINGWIDDLLAAKETTSDFWSRGDRLQKLKTDRKTRTASCSSTHVRQNGRSPRIALYHLWVEF